MTGSTNIKHGGTKSIIIISIDSGSTVAAYSDAACTTKIKDAVEKSRGEFWITGLDNETYYIKATLNEEEAIESYTISEFGAYRFSMSYFRAEITASFSTSCTSVFLTNGIDSYTVPADEISNGTYTFVVTSAGTYTGEATCTNYTLIPDAVIISNDGESFETHYKLWLYNGSLKSSGSSGANCCNDVSGGWNMGSTSSYGETCLQATQGNSDYNRQYIRNKSPIDLTPFTTFYINCQSKDYSGTNVGIATNYSASSWRVKTTTPDKSSHIFSLDVSKLENLTGYIYFGLQYGVIRLYNAWFE